MLPQDVAELLRATASDAGAVAQYLVSIDRDELDGLLDRFAAHETKKKHEQQRGDWLALVQLLLRSESARLRTATRIIQLVWNGSSSELEGMQWLTEISLSYLGALEDDSSCNEIAATRHIAKCSNSSSSDNSLSRRVRLAAIADEVRLLLRVLVKLLRDGIEAHGSANPRRALPQVLALLPILLGVLSELAAARGDAAANDQELHEHLVVLLELPWTTRTVPLLLDVLKESASIVSASGWTQLQETIERMVADADALPSESMNAIIRECVALGSVTRDYRWLSIARHVFRQLPPRLRQEAEFNLQMCLHQSHATVSLVCESIRQSLELELSGIAGDNNSHVDQPCDSDSALQLALDWRDLVFLFHALQVSRPILRHRMASSRIATDATVFAEIEQLTWAVLQLDLARTCIAAAAAEASLTRSPSSFSSADVAKCLVERVAQLLAFGGTQVHAREWKALLLLDFALFWLERDVSARSDSAAVAQLLATASVFPSRDAFARMLLLAVFQTAPEIRAELLSSLFEATKSPERVQVAGKALDELFRSQRAALFPHLNAIQDWLGVLFQSHFGSARAFFLMTSQLMPVLKDLYSHLMVFLRKLLSGANAAHQRFAIDLWCSWLELASLEFDTLQEEEIVAALANSLRVCRGLRAWTLARLEQLLHPRGCKHDHASGSDGTTVALRRSSWHELHRLLAAEVAQFIEPLSAGSAFDLDSVGDDGDVGDEDVDDDDQYASSCQRFRVSALDAFYREDTSADGAANVGRVCQRALSCLLSFEAAAATHPNSEQRLERPALGAALLRWIRDFATNAELLFHWVAHATDNDDDRDDSSEWLAVLAEPSAAASARPQQQPSQLRASAKRAMVWRLLARIGIGSALCSVAIEQQLQQCNSSAATAGTTASMWPLLEVQLCLHRLLRKLATQHGAAVGLVQPKAFVAAAAAGVAGVVDAHCAQILTDVSAQLTRSAASPLDATAATTTTSSSGAASDLSFDSLLFVLDSCSSSGRAAVPPAPAHTFRQRASAERVRVLHALLTLYTVVHTQAGTVCASDASTVFTIYAESLAAKFPRALRPLVTASSRATKHVVLLDARAADDVLMRVLTAIGRVLDAVLDTAGVAAADAQVHAMLVAMRNDSSSADSSDGDGFVALAALLLQDVSALVAQREATKLKVLTAALAKRLCDLGADVVRSSSSRATARVFAATLQQLAATVYDALCEHVVYHMPLLRALLGIALSVHLGRDLRIVVLLAGRLEGVLLACGFDAALVPTAKTKTTVTHDAVESESESESESVVAVSPGPLDSSDSDDVPVTPSKRRRLRQLAALTVPATYSVESQQATPLESCTQQPHLASSDAQHAALHAVLALLDAAQAALHRQLVASAPGARPLALRLATVQQFSALCERALHALLTSQDASWVTAKVLTKLLSAIEWRLRVAKACVNSGGAALRHVRQHGGSSDWQNACVDTLESAVRTGVEARVWVNALKDSVHEAATKTRLSATALKVDVFLSDVPQLVASFAKETQLSDALLERIRAVLALVESHLAPAAVASGSSAARRSVHLLGVVPIVKKRKRRLRSRHPFIDDWLRDEDGSDAFADLEDFIE